MATLKDVAKLACVDVSTVSRALNNSSYVHPDTKARVMDAVAQLSYQPNLLAKGLRQGKRNTIGIVIPSMMLSIFGEIAQGIELEARKLGYGVMICHTKGDPKQEEECLNRLRNGFVDGIIIASTGQNGRLVRDIQASGIAVVQLIRAQEKSISSVVADYYSCAHQGVCHLVEKGCKHIGLINGNMELVPYKERYQGYKDALKKYHMYENIYNFHHEESDNFADGLNGTHYLLDKNPQIDGILASLDMQGLGVLRALKERQIRVPSQIKVMSLTGHSIGGKLETAMTSMEIPAMEIGKKAIQMIVDIVDGGDSVKQEIEHITFDTSLVVRETT